MNEVVYTKKYQEFKKELDNELQKAADSFVMIGYLLKVARDTNILAESGYKTVTEFAQAEYGLDKTQVSRFIHINDKFAENGYSDQLQDHYRGFGYAKLTLMLQLPDAVNEQLTPDYSKSEIKSIKEEVDAENKISDLEVLMEPKEETNKSIVGQIIDVIVRDNPELYKKMWLESGEYTVEHIKEHLCPNGEKTYGVRIAGIGKLMFMPRDYENLVPIINVRNGEGSKVAWEEVLEEVKDLYPEGLDVAAAYKERYGIELEQEEESAPQPTAQRKESKVVKAKEAPKKPEKEKKEEVAPVQQTLPGIEVPDNEENQAKTDVEEDENDTVAAGFEEEQIEGQANIEDYPEFAPVEAEIVEDKNEPILIKLREIEDLVTKKDYMEAVIKADELKSMIAKCYTEVSDEE